MDVDVLLKLFKLFFDRKYCGENNIENNCIFFLSGCSGSGKTFLVNNLCNTNKIKLLRYTYYSAFLEEEKKFLNIYRNAKWQKPCCSLVYRYF
jgi:chromosomal replication initiation ATPase DnaA